MMYAVSHQLQGAESLRSHSGHSRLLWNKKVHYRVRSSPSLVADYHDFTKFVLYVSGFPIYELLAMHKKRECICP